MDELENNGNNEDVIEEIPDIVENDSVDYENESSDNIDNSQNTEDNIYLDNSIETPGSDSEIFEERKSDNYLIESEVLQEATEGNSIIEQSAVQYDKMPGVSVELNGNDVSYNGLDDYESTEANQEISSESDNESVVNISASDFYNFLCFGVGFVAGLVIAIIVVAGVRE